eukprot:superscaffoldBa00004145_g18353
MAAWTRWEQAIDYNITWSELRTAEPHKKLEDLAFGLVEKEEKPQQCSRSSSVLLASVLGWQLKVQAQVDKCMSPGKTRWRRPRREREP